MNSWLGKVLLLLVGIIFMLRGGLNLVLGLWKITLPLILLGGGYFMVKSYLQKRKQEELEGQRGARARAVRDKEKDVIEICPECLQEVGSCPACASKAKKKAKATAER